MNSKITRGIMEYEKLRMDWISKNPEASEIETLNACLNFAKHTGLILREKTLIAQISGRMGAKP